MVKITIYNINQFTKQGRLKKKPKSEMRLTIVNRIPKSEAENKEQGEYDDQYIAKTIKKGGYHSFSSPYIFTHIDALNDKNEKVIIRETVIIGSDNREVITTPKRVYKLLTGK